MTISKAEADQLAKHLESLAETVRANPPEQCEIDAKRKVVEVPGDGPWLRRADGGPESVTVDIRW